MDVCRSAAGLQQVTAVGTCGRSGRPGGAVERGGNGTSDAGRRTGGGRLVPAGQDLGDQILRRRPVTGRPPAPGKCPVRGGSVRRALRVLEAVAAGGDGITAKAVARRAGLTLLTTYRLLHTLVHEGCLVRLHQSRGYGLGYKLTGLHRRLCRQLEVTRGARCAPPGSPRHGFRQGHVVVVAGRAAS
nr:helix-turn-helix domain-containing protein [Streptomyces sp. F001]